MFLQKFNDYDFEICSRYFEHARGNVAGRVEEAGVEVVREGQGPAPARQSLASSLPRVVGPGVLSFLGSAEILNAHPRSQISKT